MINYTESYEKRMWWKSTFLLAALLGSTLVSLKSFSAVPLLEELVEDIALIIFAVCFFGKQFLASLYDLFHGNTERHLHRFAFLVLAFLIIFIANNILLSVLLSPVLAHNRHEAELNSITMTASPLLIFLCSSIFAPIVEEITFRFGLFRLFNLWNRWAAHIFTALIFGLLHVWEFVLLDHDWTQFIVMLPYCVMGLCLSILYEKTENICFPIFLHMILNSIGVVLPYLANISL